MISIDQPPRRVPPWVGIVVAVCVGAALTWWWLAGGNAPIQPMAEPGVQAAASAPVAAAPALPVPAPVAPTTLAETTGVQAQVGTTGLPQVDPNSPDAEQALREAASALPNGDVEVKRVSRFLDFQRMFERHQLISQGPSARAERLASAQRLFAMLPERIKENEISVPEGLLLCSVLLQDLEPNESRRNDRLVACGQSLEALAPKVDGEAQERAAQCQLEYRRREATLVAEFQAKAAGERDPTALERDLAKARKEVFDSATCGT